MSLCATLSAVTLVGCGAAPEEGSGDETFATLYEGYFQNCQSCHTPDAPGRTSDTEQTLDFTSEETAYTTITTGVASGLTGNEEGCNGVPFVGDSPETSLIVAALDENVRQSFSLEDHPDCDADAIADMTVKVGSAPSEEFLSSLKQWITDRSSSAVSRAPTSD